LKSTILRDEPLTDIHIVSGMGMLNPDGKSYAFDSRGAGYGRGEGVATIVLKRLDNALKDG
jgi:acyl transferase domain-containing protein